jgi:hypothetical protein
MQKKPPAQGLHKHPLNVKTFDNKKKQTPRSKFMKYGTISDYYDDYFSSDEDKDQSAVNQNDEKKLDLTEVAKNIKCLDDLIKLCDASPSQFKPCNQADLSRLKKIKQPLEELNRLIGMTELKRKIIYHALFYCQNLHNIAVPEGFNNEGDLMHTVIQGPPGCGKTTVAKIIGKIYLRLGVLKSDKFVVAKNKDLIGEFLGQTAPKTTKVLESALGGVLFIDEAYSLGNGEQRNFYSKECIETIMQFLTERKRDLVVIIAGYQDSLKTCFFAMNQGLERRFPWVYTIDNYTNSELKEIFIKQVIEAGWGFSDDNPDVMIPLRLFDMNKDYFSFGGGDTETFLNKCKLAHSLNTFGLPVEKKGKLTYNDILKGLEMHKESKGNQKSNDVPLSMYT